jgi:hypothetical protein
LYILQEISRNKNKITMRVYAGWNETDLILANSPECFWHCPQGKVDYALSINGVYEPVQVEDLLQHIVAHQQTRGNIATNLRIMQLPKDNCVYWRWGKATDGEWIIFLDVVHYYLNQSPDMELILETSGLEDRETPGKASDGRWAQLIGCIPQHTVSVHIGGLLDDMPKTFAALARPECPILKKFTLHGNFKNYKMVDMWGEEGLSRGETGHALSLGLSLEFFRNGIGPVLRRVMGQAEEVAREFKFTIDNVVGKDKYVNGVEGGQYTDYFQPLIEAGLRPTENVSLGRIYFPVEFFKTNEEMWEDPRAEWYGGPQIVQFFMWEICLYKRKPPDGFRVTETFLHGVPTPDN